jgi:hypothetical protein
MVMAIYDQVYYAVFPKEESAGAPHRMLLDGEPGSPFRVILKEGRLSETKESVEATVIFPKEERRPSYRRTDIYDDGQTRKYGSP